MNSRFSPDDPVQFFDFRSAQSRVALSPGIVLLEMSMCDLASFAIPPIEDRKSKIENA
jgi:hypothetical protein